LTFQVVHQASEVLLKGAAWELERALGHLEHGDYANTARLIRRANMEIEYPISLLHVLETITPYDYHVIRAGLPRQRIGFPRLSRAASCWPAPRTRLLRPAAECRTNSPPTL